MAKKMPRSLVAVSSSAIAAVYLAGYLTTRSADASLAPASTGPTTVAPASLPVGAGPSPALAPGANSIAPAGAAAAAAGQAALGSTFQDGTFQGRGTSRRGDVGVAVTIQGGRIANVKITGATTQYPVSRIAALPGEVVARQSAQIDRVSGATYSAQAFQQAVQQALAQARVAGAPAAAATG